MAGTDPFDPNDPFQRMLRDAERHQALIRGIEKALGGTRSEYAIIEQMRQAQLEQERREKLFRSVAGPAEYRKSLETLLASYETTRARVERLTAGGDRLGEALRRIREENERWGGLHAVLERQAKLSSELERRLVGSTLTYERALETLLKVVGRGQIQVSAPMLGANLLAPIEAYSRYARAALGREANATDDSTRVAASAGLSLADAQIAKSADLVSSVGAHAVADGEAPQSVDGIPTTDIEVLSTTSLVSIERVMLAQESELREQHSVLVSIPSTPLLIEGLSAHALRSRAQHTVGRLAVACNEAAQIVDRAPIFAPSNKLLECFSQLAWIDASNRDELGKLVDVLYFMLYDSTGKQSRLSKYLPTEALEVVAIVTVMRNKVFRHDIGQGDPNGLPFQLDELAKRINALGSPWPPFTGDEHLAVHDALLTSVTRLLEELLSTLRARQR